MSGVEKNNDQPDVRSSSSEIGTPQKKEPRVPNLSTKENMMSDRRERHVTPQKDTESRNLQTTTDNKAKVDLNVNAQEFVPNKFRHVLSGDAEAFQPKVPVHQYAEGAEFLEDNFENLTLGDQNSYYNSAESEIVQRFKKVLHTLNMSPGNMEEYLKPLCEEIKGTADSSNVARSLCDPLLRQSIREENFRYTGARICQFLESHLSQDKNGTGFAKMFLSRCEIEFIKRNELLHGSEEDKKEVCGLAIFLAEIFLNVQTKSRDGTEVRFYFMLGNLIDMIKTLLSAPDDMTVKCVCQHLKLVGGLLEDAAKEQSERCAGFESIFDELQQILNSTILSPNIKILVQSVLDMKGKDWNRSSTSPPKREESYKPHVMTFEQEPVFYSNGRECSRDEVLPDEVPGGMYELTIEEELAFYEWEAEREGTGLPWNDTGGEDWMGEEEEAAYDEFLQDQMFSGQTHSGQSHSGQMHTGQMHTGQTYSGQRHSGQTYSGQTYTGQNETGGFQRQSNTAAHQPGVYAQPNEDMYSQSRMYPYNENPGHAYPQQFYEGGRPEVMNQMSYQHLPQPQQSYHPRQMQQSYDPRQHFDPQQSYDSSYQQYPPNNSFPPH